MHPSRNPFPHNRFPPSVNPGYPQNAPLRRVLHNPRRSHRQHRRRCASAPRSQRAKSGMPSHSRHASPSQLHSRMPSHSRPASSARSCQECHRILGPHRPRARVRNAIVFAARSPSQLRSGHALDPSQSPGVTRRRGAAHHSRCGDLHHQPGAGRHRPGQGTRGEIWQCIQQRMG